MINGTEFVNNPWNTTFSPFTNLFQIIFGNGNVFYLVPLIALTIGIYYKTDEPVLASLFMIGSGGILSLGTFFAGVETLGIMFTIFAAIGIAVLVISLIMQTRS